MADSQPDIMQRFGMQRPNFILDPINDADLWARTDIDVHAIVENLQIDLVTSVAPKRLFYGPYGGGKTHTLHKTMRELGKITSIHPVHVECPDLSKRSTFLELYRDAIMRAIGEEFVLGLLESTLSAIGILRRDDLLKKLKDSLGDEELAKATARLVDPNFDKLKLWAWISGVTISKADLSDLGQTQDLTSVEAARLAFILVTLGRLLKEREGKTLILILDEMDRMGFVGPETIVTFRTGFTRLVDPNQKFVSVLIGVSARVLQDVAPDIFAANTPVTSRIGADNQISIPALLDPDVENFIKAIIAYVRDQSANVNALVSAASKTTKEKVTPELFPFTNQAIDALKAKLMADMTPREITMNMTKAVGRAQRLQRDVITSELIQ